MMKKLIPLIVLILLVTVVPLALRAYTSLLWFDSWDFGDVFWTRIGWMALASAVAGAFFLVVLLVNLRIAARSIPHYYVTPESTIEFLRYPAIQRYASLITTGAAVFFSVWAAAAAATHGDTFLMARSAQDFGMKEPVFGLDASFYVYTLPALSAVWSLLFWAAVASAVVVAAFYAVNGVIALAQGARQMAPFAARHLKIIAGVLVALLGFGVLLIRYRLLFGSSGVVDGAGFTDVYATIPFLWVLSVAFILLGILITMEAALRRSLRSRTAAVLVAAVMIAAVGYPSIVQQFRVLPNELSLERPFLQRSIDMTRKAWGLDKVKELPFPADDRLDEAALVRNKQVISDIRLWDWRPLLTTYGQIQEIRTYYTFHDVDVDRYVIDGRQRQLMLSARELSVDQLDENARTWVNEHQVFLHGYGAVANPVNQIGEEGLPSLLLKDIPPKSEYPELELKRPQIYFGELTNSYALVRTKTREFDHPGENANVYTKYTEDSGIPMAPLLNRLAYSASLGTAKILLSDAITDETRLLIDRNIMTLATRIAPFLTFDRDPYLVIDNGKLKWVIDGYTTATRVPYSHRVDGFNYMRNSVKVVIDAYSGDPTFYAMDKTDPVLGTLRKAFPSLFVDGDRLPGSLRKHLRYPVDLFERQSTVLSAYHMKDTDVFYNREDQWVFPNELFGEEQVPVEPYYVTMTIPSDASADGRSADSRGKDGSGEFVLYRPFNPRGKSNLVSALAARNDGENYGELILFKYPKDRLVYGTMQIESLINQDPTISAQLSLWNQEGSSVIRGNLMVVPVESSLLYVEPLYLQSKTGQLPELKRVIVTFKGKVAMASTLGGALAGVFDLTNPDILGVGGVDSDGDGVPSTADAEGGDADGATEDSAALPADVVRLVRSADRSMRQAEEAQKAGDWAAYGEAQQSLKRTLQELARRSAR